MKIAVTSTGQDLDSPMDPRFGRAAYILIVDSDTLDFEVLDNAENVNAFKGAGIQAATMISDKKAEVLLTGFCGPNAFKTLDVAGVKVAGDVSGTVREAVAAFVDGKAKLVSEPNAQGYW
ncbi:MAG: NifB/NifX family molybdenum-iron cluster-binding protein [Desulfosarcina sp.]|nr:NifB/NifX family molybdenum-iron cluster-binding protein [Desulfosarcina sp.]MBC2741859.1 NifB/NifX family molybdenum-iron cluster-binding protein [Desulfosarcina sp.]MBC2764772.1 dinitrogenase iron-molybdenum cofactor biosynthesis protein [Desulfosarcina sp.]